MCKDPISKQGHVLRSLVNRNWGGAHYYSAQYNKFRSPLIFNLSQYPKQLLEIHLLGHWDFLVLQIFRRKFWNWWANSGIYFVLTTQTCKNGSFFIFLYFFLFFHFYLELLLFHLLEQIKLVSFRLFQPFPQSLQVGIHSGLMPPDRHLCHFCFQSEFCEQGLWDLVCTPGISFMIEHPDP